MTFAELFEKFSWRPIKNCPGRYVLQGAEGKPRRIEELTGSKLAVTEHKVSAARDLVLVAALDCGGGIISYQREDGSFLHTLNTCEGFHRKLGQLGVHLAEDRFVA